MNWIEGVGDEVTLFFALLAIVLVGSIAWLSTSIGEQPVIRTVLLVERWNRHTHDSDDPVGAAASGANSGGDTSHEAIYTAVSQGCECADAGPRPESFVTPGSVAPDSVTPDSVTPDPVTQESATVADPASAQSSPSQSRLSGDSSKLPEAKPVDSAEARLDPGSELDPESGPPGQIWIRLKYLNDDQKLVQGRLEEPLGDFKRRHFTSELTADNLVRLIFNGHILHRDAATLESYGLFDNCVVHCLVHQQRPSAAAAAAAAAAENAFTPTRQAAADAQAAAENNVDWNVGNALPVLLTLLLAVAWYCRFQFSHLFTATTSVTLVGLTVILGLSLLGIYLPGQDVAAPVP